MNLKIVNKTLKESNRNLQAENKQLRLDLKYAKAHNKLLAGGESFLIHHSQFHAKKELEDK